MSEIDRAIRALTVQVKKDPRVYGGGALTRDAGYIAGLKGTGYAVWEHGRTPQDAVYELLKSLGMLETES